MEINIILDFWQFKKVFLYKTCMASLKGARLEYIEVRILYDIPVGFKFSPLIQDEKTKKISYILNPISWKSNHKFLWRSKKSNLHS